MNTFLKTLLCASVCSALLVGCGGDKSTNTSNGDSKTATTTQDAKPADTASEVKAENKTLAISAIVEHPALDAVRQGAIEYLATQGFKEGENLKVNFQSAQGNMATAGQIAKQFSADNPNVVLAIATPTAQAMVAASSEIPIVFAAVTEPVEAKLVPKLDGSGTNVTGVSDVLPYEPQVELIKEVIPNVKTVGFVYSPGEVNSVVALDKLKKALEPHGIKVLDAPAQKTTDIALAAQSLQGKVDVIYTSTDNNVVSAYEALYQVAKEAKIPLIASNPESVDKGAAAALGVNYKDLGVEAGKMIARIYKGEKAGDIPVYSATALDLVVSPKHAQEQGFTLPESVVKRASKVVE